MKNKFTLIFLLFIVTDIVLANNIQLDSNAMKEQPLLFTQNKGQVTDMKGETRPDVLFTTHSKGVKLFFNKNGISYQFQKKEYPEGYDEMDDSHNIDRLELAKQFTTTTYRMDMELVGASSNPIIITEEKTDYYENYYLANCPDGILNVPSFTKIIYKDIYPNIDWVIYTKGQEMKYDFVVHPGGDPGIIKMEYKGANEIKITEDGNLLITTPFGEVIEQKPESFQNKVFIESFFVINNETITFKVNNYNKSEDLIIDPGLSWATYYGGSGSETWTVLTVLGDVAVDNSGNVYLTGATESMNGIASGGFLNTFSGSDLSAFLVKFNTNGDRLWATYYGVDYTRGYGVTTDSNGNAFLVGETLSNSSIASGGFQNTFGGGFDAFLVKFNSNGIRQWATYYGGTDSDFGKSVITDLNNNIYLAGFTESTNGIASNGFQNSFGGGDTDAFLVKFNNDGTRLWATYYGGNGDDSGYMLYNKLVATDDNGNVYLAGRTDSPSNIASGGFQNSLSGVDDAFLVKFDSNGGRLWATYYGGSGSDRGYGVATDNIGNVYLAGTAGSSSGIAFNGFQNTFGPGFLVKFDTNGSRLWGTYYGGVVSDIVTDFNEDIYITGYATSSNSNIAEGGYQNVYGGGLRDAFVAKFNSTGSRIGGSFYGGSDDDRGTGIATDASGNFYLSGYTESENNISYQGFQNTYGGGNCDVFLAKFNECAFYGPSITPATISICSGQNTILTASGGNSYLWSTGASTASITINPTQATTYTVTATSSSNCGGTANVTVNVFPNPASSISVDGVITAVDTIACGDIVQLHLNGSFDTLPNILWSPNTSISNTTITSPYIYPCNTINYTATFTNSYGCTQSSSVLVYVSTSTTIGNISLTAPSDTIGLLDTLTLTVQLNNINGLYSLYMKLKGDTSVSNYLNYVGYTAGTLLGTGGSIISTPPVFTNGVYDFGITKVGAVPGFSGNGIFYTFKFVTKNVTIPANTNFCFYLDDINAYNASGIQVGLINQSFFCNTFTDKLKVWPGDLNNSKTVTTADLLPIGYFYNSTGPARANASIQWIAQPATLWGFGQASTSGSAYKTFADSNGDGLINNADQAAIGFNMGKIHAFWENLPDNPSRTVSDGDIIVTASPSTINPQEIPQLFNLQVELGNTGGLNSLYGISFNLILDNTVFDLSTAVIDYAGSIFGTAGIDCLNIEYITDTTISIGLTRYANNAINGNGILCNIQLQTKSSLPVSIDQTLIHTFADAANTQAGDPLMIQSDDLIIDIENNTAVVEVRANPVIVYPNPANEVIYISTKVGDQSLMGFQVSVYNAIGQKVHQTVITEDPEIISTHTWVSGFYTLEIRDREGYLYCSKKLVKH